MSSLRVRCSDRRGVKAAEFAICVFLWLAACGLANGQNPRAWAGSEAVPTTSAAAADDVSPRIARVEQSPETSSTTAAPLPVVGRADALAPAAPTPGHDAASAELIPTGNLLSVVGEGGVLMLPLLCCSFVLAAFGIERFVSLRTGRVLPRLFVDRFLEQFDAGEHDRQSALEACEGNGSPAAVVAAAAVRRWGRPAVEIEQAVIDAGEREISRLSRYRRVFQSIASTAPMLGLLGTVFGLIRSFNDVASAGAMGRPDLLAKGFGEALITTAMGLLVAIPAMVMHSWLTGRVEFLAMRLDEFAQHVVEAISLEPLDQRGKPRGSTDGSTKRAA
jgi:biopolymer transport protein ExbB